METYTFETENPFLAHPDPFQEGLRLMQYGSLTEAALAFEASVQRDSEDARGWYYLGKAQAENEKEIPAIAALQQAVQLDPTNKEALMLLSVSYVNEGYESKAYAALHKWIVTHRPDLGSIEQERMTMDQMRDRLVELYLEAASSTEVVDASVQIGLGLLFYNVQDYEKSIDCFSAALAVRPDDYALWNRLGATLANSGESERAIDSYYKALEIKPSFVRARFNLGISCINIGCYKEAAEHFLNALHMHDLPNQKDTARPSNVSETLWSTLRRTFILMNRQDLADLAHGSQDLSIFKSEFEFS
ncbi:hypothetical protein EDD86DRAFT_193502 [Gorgonomyces haynaldii]|nr:hypothetical protein EDD86DRAFT_193502 [Gorgonomyces haynaldii]